MTDQNVCFRCKEKLVGPRKTLTQEGDWSQLVRLEWCGEDSALVAKATRVENVCHKCVPLEDLPPSLPLSVKK
jgi:hypothetical protein